MPLGRAQPGQNLVRQQRVNVVHRVNVSGSHIRPIRAKLVQARFHRTQDKPHLLAQRFRRSLAAADYVMRIGRSPGNFPGARHHEGIRRLPGWNRVGEGVQHRLGGRIDLRRDVSASHRRKTVL